jgi:hypothetical protein
MELNKEIKDLIVKQFFEKLLKPNKDDEDPRNGTIQIVVLQRGFVVVGLFERKGDTVFIKNSSTIRRWGTTKGLGEIASNGPTESTVLDKEIESSTHVLTIIKCIPCVLEKWSQICK